MELSIPSRTCLLHLTNPSSDGRLTERKLMHSSLLLETGMFTWLELNLSSTRIITHLFVSEIQKIPRGKFARWISKGGKVDCMEVVLCLSQKVAKNGQILSMFVPKKWLFSLLLQSHQGWLFKSKNWLMSKICQTLSLVSGFF